MRGCALVSSELTSTTSTASVSPRQIVRTAVEAGHISGMTLLLISTSVAVGFMLASDLIPMQIAQSVSGLTKDKHVVLLILNLFFIATGILLEPPAVIVAFLPAVMPLLHAVGVDPVVWASSSSSTRASA